MARPLRIEAPEHYFHVLARGNARHPIFLDDEDRVRFLETVGEALERFRARCHAYCLMGNHYHLLLQPREENLSRTLRHVNGVYSQRFNRRHGRVGHVFAGRFKSLLVDRETYLREIVRYIVLNPVRAGFVENPEEWRWSSYRTTGGLTSNPAWLTVAEVLDLFGEGSTAAARESFRSFVGEGLGEASDREAQTVRSAAERGGIFGSAEFVRRSAARIGSRVGDRQHPRGERFPARPPLHELFFGCPDTGPKWERTVRAALSVHGYGRRELAAWLGVDRGTIARALGRADDERTNSRPGDRM